MASAEATPRRVEDFQWPSAEVNECPFDFYAALREQAPVYRLPGRSEYVVSRWEDVAYVAEHPEIFSVSGAGRTDGNHPASVDVGEPLTSGSIAVTDPPEHARKRSLAKLFVAREMLRTYEPKIQLATDGLIDAFIERGEVEFYDEFADHLPTIVIADILGLPQDPEMIKTYQHWNDSEGTGSIFASDERMAELAVSGAEVLAFMREQVAERIAHPRENDFMSALIKQQVERDGAPAAEYLADEAILLLFAGNVTTTHTMTSAMLTFLEHPEQMARLRKDRKLLRSALEEVVRLECPVQFLHRIVVADTEIHGVPVPEGAMILMILGAANRDHDALKDADRFIIGRPGASKSNLGFGRGIHRCLGAPLARLEMETAFNTLFDRLHNIRLADKNTYRHLGHPTFRAPRPLHLEFDPGHPVLTG